MLKVLITSGRYHLIQRLVSCIRFTPGQEFEPTDGKNFKAKPVFTQVNFPLTSIQQGKES